ncbi:nagb/rpia/CoA transferase-like protein [Exidia glandulosa HHB12029]|uniref:Translation initiation factor eIF2B subunit alpha n=1 Tax=Exidia glandulosa HHB12029 TaxID=1314781 RepID=A0A166B3W5_EXIGL|nr:nagb/rpia/CoA transferase-like protein [Exidia glandulosa HHB12029]
MAASPAVLSPSSALTPTPSRPEFNVVDAYEAALKHDSNLSAPLAAILALAAMISGSDIGTMAELLTALHSACTRLQQHRSAIGISAGCNLFTRFVAQYQDHARDFEHQKVEIVNQGRKFVDEAKSYRAKIARLALSFVQDDFVILTHSYSRVVMEALLLIHKHKRISVFVTEARPNSLGQKTCDASTAAGIPCTLVLDSAVAYVIDQVDVCMVGSEAVVESGGLVNAVGSYQMALVAKYANKPFYALAESYKFHRLFPLSQSDVATAASAGGSRHSLPSSESGHSSSPSVISPAVDYTKPKLISHVFSDVGILTPDGVSQYLVSMFLE